MFVIKKIGERSFIYVNWYEFVGCEYKWSRVSDDGFNVAFFSKEEAYEVASNLNQDEDGNFKEICEVVEVMLPEFRLV